MGNNESSILLHAQTTPGLPYCRCPWSHLIPLSRRSCVDDDVHGPRKPSGLIDIFSAASFWTFDKRKWHCLDRMDMAIDFSGSSRALCSRRASRAVQAIEHHIVFRNLILYRSSVCFDESWGLVAQVSFEMQPYLLSSTPLGHPCEKGCCVWTKEAWGSHMSRPFMRSCAFLHSQDAARW